MLWWFAQTTMIAAALAALAMLAGRSKRLGPEAKHALWLVVLVKLMIPPLVAWPWALPDSWPRREVAVVQVKPMIEDVKAPVEVAQVDPLPAPIPSPVLDLGPAPDIETIPTGEAAPEPKVEVVPAPVIVDPPILEAHAPIARSRPWDWSTALIGVWLAGSLVVITRRVILATRFGRALRSATHAPEWLMDEVRATAKMLGVRPPPVQLSPCVSTPLLWCLGRPTLVLPEALVDRLSSDRWPGIIAHELAHLSRRDHWVVRLELAAEAVWWWSPLFRLVRDRLREEAELACDVRVVRALPDRRFAYAEALVDVCEHLIRPEKAPSPALGVVGPKASRALEGRLLMILKGPDRRPSTRLAASASLLLVAMALPAWTLGQQPEPAKAAEPPKVESPVKVADEPKVEPAAKPAGLWTVEQVEDAFSRRWGLSSNLAVRYVVTTRFDSDTGHRVDVQASDVAMNEKMSTRLDVYHAKPGVASPPAWSRWLEIRSENDVKSLRVDSAAQGPVPFRWRSEKSSMQSQGITSVFSSRYSLPDGDNNRFATEMPGLHPLMAVDLFGPTYWLLNATVANANVVGVETVDGREAVRVAWIDKQNVGIRGIAWYAPALGFAMVRADVVMVLGNPGENRPVGRWSWRKKCEDFAKFGDLWLPARVTTRSIQVEPDGKVTSDVEQRVLLEDYRVDADLPDDAFDARLPVQALDDVTGDFTTIPPPSAPGLIDRLKRAVAESPFGPPAQDQLKAETFPNVPAVADAAGALQKARAELDAIVRRSRSSTEPEEVEARKRWEKVRQDYLRIGEVSRKEAADKVNEDAQVKQARDKEDQAQDQIAVIKPVDLVAVARFKADPQVAALTVKLNDTKAKLEASKRKTRDMRDPGVRLLEKQLGTLNTQWNDLWEQKQAEYAESTVPAKVAQEAAAAKSVRDQVVARFEADPEVVDIARKYKEADAKLGAMAQIKDVVGEPAVLTAQGKRDELRKQYDTLWESKSRLIGEQVTDEIARGVPAGRAGAGDPVKVFQAHRDAKLVEVVNAEARLNLAKNAVARIKIPNGAGVIDVPLEEMRRTESEATVAEAELVRRNAELAEADAMLAQAQRPPARADIAEAGDTVKGAQDRRDTRAAEVVKAEAQLQLARNNVVRTRIPDGPGVIDVTLEGIQRVEAVAVVADAELRVRKAELAEADELLDRAKRRPGRVEHTEAGDAVKLAQARRDAKAAGVAGAEARQQRIKAVVDRNKVLIAKNPSFVSEEQSQKGEAELVIADAELAKKKAELAEAEPVLEQAKRPLARAESPEVDDAVKLVQLRRDAKAAGVVMAEARQKLAAMINARSRTLLTRNAIRPEEARQSEADLAAAEADIVKKKAELVEADTMLEQAKRGPIPAPGADVRSSRAGLTDKAIELEKAEVRLRFASEEMARQRAVGTFAGSPKRDLVLKSEAAYVEAVGEFARRKAELDESGVGPARVASTSTLAELRDAIDLLKIQLDGKKAEVEGLVATLRHAEIERNNTARLVQTNAVSKNEAALYEANLAKAQANVSAKKAEVSEYELRIKQATRRAEAEEARLKREADRAKVELDRRIELHKSGQLDLDTLEAARDKYDDLMIQLDPNHIATPIKR